VVGANGTAFDPTVLNAPLAAAFTATQPAPIVPPNVYARISDTSLDITGAPLSLGSITLLAGGSGYKSVPAVRFLGGGGSGAAATATVTNGVVTAVNITNFGSGYTSAPLVSFIGGRPTTVAEAVAALNGATPMLPKTIQELFDPIGRMNSTLGVEIPFTTATIQTTIPLGFVDPATEVIPDGATQLWKITHNGVDTHAIHFHLFNVQVVNRIGWDGAIKPPWPEELGWKETVKMNPLEDIVVALRAKVPTVPFVQPDNIRALDPANPLGSTAGFFGVDANGNPVTVVNALANFGNEYTWHCHLLGHEENDMMRPLSVAVPPAAPSNLKATQPAPNAVKLTWTNNAKTNAFTGVTVQRANNSAFTSNLLSVNVGNVTTYTDTTFNASAIPYYYRVFATDTVGSGVAGYPSVPVASAFSNVVGPPAAAVTLNSVTQAAAAGSPIVLNWSVAAGGTQTGYTIQRARDSGFTTNVVQYNAGNVTTLSLGAASAVPGVTYWYRVIPKNFLGVGTPSNGLSIVPHA
jgi:hypothetical protein